MNSEPEKKPSSGRKQKTALETAAGMLSARACTKLELRRKLYKKDKFEPREIERAVAELERMGYLSDRHYAEDAIGILRSRGFGPIRIRRRLLTKGISRKLLDELMSADDPDCSGETDVSRATALLLRNERRFSKDEPEKKKLRALRMLAGRGFSSSTSYQAVEQWLKGNANESD